MPDLDWNRKWGTMIASFTPGEKEPNFGDRWGDPETFGPLLEVRERFVNPYVRPGTTVLEIGSGGGRWTQYLAPAGHLVSVEFNPESFSYLRARFPELRIDTYQTSGFEMHGVASESIDFLFTFDVFVHLEPSGIQQYLHEIERVLKRGAVAVVHYADIRKDIALRNEGFARMTRATMEALLATTNLQVLDHDETIMFHSNLVALRRP
jgi:SAM-dependent methyltransferase